MIKSACTITWMHLKDARNGLIIFWSILLGAYGATLIVAYLTEGPSYIGGSSFAILIFMFIYGITTMKETLPYALGMSVRRTDFWIGTAMMAVILSLGNSIFHTLLSRIEETAITSAGMEFNFFHQPSITNQYPAWAEGFTLFILLLHVYFLGFAISSISYRFGRTGMYTLGTAVFLLITSLTLFGRWDEVVRALASIDTLLEFSMWLLLLVIVYAGCSYLFLRRVTLQN